jgi:predicted transcriptional regulator
MPKKLNEEDRLSEMLTVVTTPGMRARLDHAAERRETKDSYLVRQAIRVWLDENEPMGQAEIDALTAAYLAEKNSKKGN